ncbi:BatD family protein [Vibrio navarrensis]
MKKLSLFLILLIGVVSQHALANSLVASVNKTRLAQNELIELRIRADFSVDSSDIDFSVLDNDFFKSGPQFSSAKNYINGQYSQKSEWVLSISPKRTGKLTIPAFSAGGLQSQPIELIVSSDSNTPKVSDIIQYSMQLGQQTLYPAQTTPLKVEIRIKADPRRLENPRIIPPSVNGLSMQPVGQSKQYQVVEQGLQVTVVEQNYLISAQTAGEYEIQGPQFQGSLIYGDSLTGSARLLSLNSSGESKHIEVKAIPANASRPWLPASQLALTQSWQTSQGGNLDSVEQGSAISRIIKLKAKGISADLLPEIAINYPDSVRVYPEKPQFSTADDGSVEMTVKQVLIPSQTGRLTLPELSIDWWNTQSDQPKRATLAGLTLDVTPSSSQVLSLPAASQINNESNQNPAAESGSSPIWVYLTSLFAALWVLTLLAFALYWRRQTRRTPAPHQQQALMGETSVLQAIERGDAAQIEAATRVWLNQHKVDAALRAKIEQQLELMHQAHFSAQQGAWTPEQLKLLLSRVGKSHNRQEQPLAKL